MKYLLPTAISLYIFSLLGELGSFWWVFDLFSHWRSLYVIAGSLLIVWALFAKQLKWAFAAGVVTLCHIIVVAAYVQILPFTMPVRAAELTSNSEENLRVTEEGKRELTVAFTNTYWRSPDMDQVIAGIKEMNPDVIFLEEIQPEQFAVVTAALPEYTFALHAPVEYAFDMGVLSKVPVTEQQIHFFMADVPLIEIVVMQNGKELHLMGVHPHSPVSYEFTEDRNKYLKTLFEYVGASSDSIVMGGDYNISQFSPVYRELMRDTRMIDTQHQFKLTNTWPTKLPTWAAIPIDQVFVTPDVKVIDRYRGAFTGSDHWPIVVKVAL